MEDLTVDMIDIFKFRKVVEQRVSQASGFIKALLFFKHDYLQQAYPSNNHKAVIQHFVITLECGVFETDPKGESMRLQDKDLFDSVYIIGLDLQRMSELHLRAITDGVKSLQ
jgi:hypothetical protein